MSAGLFGKVDASGWFGPKLSAARWFYKRWVTAAAVASSAIALSAGYLEPTSAEELEGFFSPPIEAPADEYISSWAVEIEEAAEAEESFLSSLVPVLPAALRLPTATGITTNSVTLGATTTVADGTLYVVAFANFDPPPPISAEEVKASNNGVDFWPGSSGAVTNAAPSAPVIGLTPSTDYGYALTHETAAGLSPMVLLPIGSGFTTSASDAGFTGATTADLSDEDEPLQGWLGLLFDALSPNDFAALAVGYYETVPDELPEGFSPSWVEDSAPPDFIVQISTDPESDAPTEVYSTSLALLAQLSIDLTQIPDPVLADAEDVPDTEDAASALLFEDAPSAQPDFIVQVATDPEIDAPIEVYGSALLLLDQSPVVDLTQIPDPALTNAEDVPETEETILALLFEDDAQALLTELPDCEDAEEAEPSSVYQVYDLPPGAQPDFIVQVATDPEPDAPIDVYGTALLLLDQPLAVDLTQIPEPVLTDTDDASDTEETILALLFVDDAQPFTTELPDSEEADDTLESAFGGLIEPTVVPDFIAQIVTDPEDQPETEDSSFLPLLVDEPADVIVQILTEPEDVPDTEDSYTHPLGTDEFTPVDFVVQIDTDFHEWIETEDSIYFPVLIGAGDQISLISNFHADWLEDWQKHPAAYAVDDGSVGTAVSYNGLNATVTGVINMTPVVLSVDSGFVTATPAVAGVTATVQGSLVRVQAELFYVYGS